MLRQTLLHTVSILALPPELSQEEQIKVVEKFCERFYRTIRNLY